HWHPLFRRPADENLRLLFSGLSGAVECRGLLSVHLQTTALGWRYDCHRARCPDFRSVSCCSSGTDRAFARDYNCGPDCLDVACDPGGCTWSEPALVGWRRIVPSCCIFHHRWFFSPPSSLSGAAVMAAVYGLASTSRPLIVALRFPARSPA